MELEAGTNVGGGPPDAGAVLLSACPLGGKGGKPLGGMLGPPLGGKGGIPPGGGPIIPFGGIKGGGLLPAANGTPGSPGGGPAKAG